MLSETIRDPDAQIIFEARDSDFSVVGMVEICVTGITAEEHDGVIKDMRAKLTEAGLVIMLSFTNNPELNAQVKAEKQAEAARRMSPASTSITPEASTGRRPSLGGGKKTVPMPGLREAAAAVQLAHLFYVQDEAGSSHFTEVRREQTKLMLIDVMRAHKLAVDLGHRLNL